MKKQKIEIKILGQIDSNCHNVFSQFEVVSENNFTILYGTIEDQDSLFKVLNKVNLLNLTLISVNQL